MTLPRVYILLYLLALSLVGIGYLAILPPFEGFDEDAHYSSIRQIADTGAIPTYGASFLDREATDYKGPVAYGTLAPPFDRGLVYSKFFDRPDLVRDYLTLYRRPAPSQFSPSPVQNWEAQHPPLYYLLLAPIEKAVEQFPFVTRIFILRLVSYAMALGGVALGLASLSRPAVPSNRDASIVGFLLYPIALPMFFPEFTRR